MRNKGLLFLLLIFIVGFFVRFYLLWENNPPLYADETNGHYWHFFEISQGNLFWTTFSSTWFFGLNPLGVRSLAAIYSSLIPLLLFLFVKVFTMRLSNSNKLSLVAALLGAVLPWSFMVGRIGHSQIPLLVLIVLTHLILFSRAKTLQQLIVSLLPLSIALFYYQSSIVILPFAAAPVFAEIWLLLDKKNRTKTAVTLALFFVILITLGVYKYKVFSPTSRALDLAIWRDVNTPFDTDKYRALSWNSQPSVFSFGLPPEQLANKLFLNRITANLTIFARNYLSFFSPDWLFLRGDAILRHSTGMVGAFYPFLIPFMLYGAFRFFSTADKKASITFLVWILVSPIPAAITKDGAGYLLRAVTMLPFLTYFCALGLVDSFSLFRKSWRCSYGVALGLIAIYSVWSFFYGYFHIYPALSARAYEYGFKELSDFQVKNGGKTMLVVWDGYYPVGHFLFWQRIPFSQYEKMKITPIGIGETTFWKTLPNLYFAVPKDTKNVADFIKEYKPDYLVLPDRYFVKYSDDLLKLTKEKVAGIAYPDKTTAFTIYSLK